MIQYSMELLILQMLYRGVIVRDEKVYNTTVDGVISYDVADGEKVKPNTEVCSI